MASASSRCTVIKTELMYSPESAFSRFAATSLASGALSISHNTKMHRHIAPENYSVPDFVIFAIQKECNIDALNHPSLHSFHLDNNILDVITVCTRLLQNSNSVNKTFPNISPNFFLHCHSIHFTSFLLLHPPAAKLFF